MTGLNYTGWEYDACILAAGCKCEPRGGLLAILSLGNLQWPM